MAAMGVAKCGVHAIEVPSCVGVAGVLGWRAFLGSLNLAVRFIIGRAGTGKTEHCVAAIARELAAVPVGPPLVWIVPDQATFNAERLLALRVGGTFRATVMSFRRMVHLLAGDLGIGGEAMRTGVDDLARIVLLGDLVRQRRGELGLFGPIADRPGFIARLDVMLRELQQAAHTGQSLRAAAERIEKAGDRGAGARLGGVLERTGEDGTASVLVRKLRDLALLLEAWDGELEKQGMSAERLAELVAGQMAKCDRLRGAKVWVDAFSALNVVEVRMLTALAQQVESVEITLMGSGEMRNMKRETRNDDEMGLFARTGRMYRVLSGALERAGVMVLPPVVLREQHRLKESALAAIEGGLFAEGSAALRHKSAGGESEISNLRVEKGAVELWECANPLVEVTAAAQAIRRMITEGGGDRGLRYRDIGLIVPGLEEYADALRRVFAQHKIPHFLDQRRSMAHHPLVEFLRSAVAFVNHEFDTRDLVLLLKTGLTGVAEEKVHQFENYLLAHGVRRWDLAVAFTYAAPNVEEQDEEGEGGQISAAERAALKAVNETREELRAKMAGWVEAARSAADGGALARGLWGLLAAFGVPGQMAGLIQKERGAGGRGGDAELLMIHEQAWRQVVGLLETLERVLGDEEGTKAQRHKGTAARRGMTLADFGAVLGSALESLTLGLIPPTVDQVLVSSVTRSRHPELKVVFILGAVETRFPLVRPEDPLLSDRQREVFNAHAGEPINEGSERDLLEAKFFDYVAFTRSSGKLIVSYPLADMKGKAVGRSQYVTRLAGAGGAGGLFPGLKAQAMDAAGLLELGAIATLDDALASALQQRRYTKGEGQDEEGLWEWLTENEDAGIREAVAWVRPALLPVTMPALGAGLAERLHGRDLRISVSQLQKFAECPFEYFLQYTLALKERPLLEMDVLNLGTLYHRILERVFDRVIARTLAWPGCAEPELRAAVTAETAAAAKELHAELAQTTPGYAQMIARTARQLGTVLEGQRRAARAGDVRPMATEVMFGMGSGGAAPRKISLPFLEIKTASGRRGLLRGKIDRVDAGSRGAAVVIDYKSGALKELRINEVLAGVTLQLPVYLLVVQAVGEQLGKGKLSPAAAFYVPLGRPRRVAEDLAKLEYLDPRGDAFHQQNRPRGMIDAARILHLDDTVDGVVKRWSDWYRFKRTKGTAKGVPGELAKSGNDGWEHADFVAMLEYVRRKVATMVDALAGGEIGPRPVKLGAAGECERCAFTAMCPFDRVRGEYRVVEKLKREDALARMRET